MDKLLERKKSKKKKAALVILIVVILLGAVASMIMAARQEADDAKKVVDDFYTSVKMGDYDGAARFYHSKLFEITPKSEMDSMLNLTDSKLGHIEGYSLLDYNSFSASGQSHVSMVYLVNRTKYHSEETFQLYKEDNGTVLKIVGYHVSSNGFVLN